MVEITSKRMCIGCGEEVKGNEAVHECGMPLESEQSVTSENTLKQKSRVKGAKSTGKRAFSPAEYIAQFLSPARSGLQVAVALFQDKVLTVDGESPYGNDMPTAIMFLDRFNDDVLDLPIWEKSGIDLDGDYDCFPALSRDLFLAIQNRMKVESAYKEIQKARGAKTVSILEAKLPALRHLLKSKAELPPLHFVVQTGQAFQVIEVPTAAILAEAFVLAGMWAPEIAAWSVAA